MWLRPEILCLRIMIMGVFRNEFGKSREEREKEKKNMRFTWNPQSGVMCLVRMQWHIVVKKWCECNRTNAERAKRDPSTPKSCLKSCSHTHYPRIHDYQNQKMTHFKWMWIWIEYFSSSLSFPLFGCLSIFIWIQSSSSSFKILVAWLCRLSTQNEVRSFSGNQPANEYSKDETEKINLTGASESQSHKMTASYGCNR